jgi:hypothetical protein
MNKKVPVVVPVLGFYMMIILYRKIKNNSDGRTDPESESMIDLVLSFSAS